jgi:hypothetical protein
VAASGDTAIGVCPRALSSPPLLSPPHHQPQNRSLVVGPSHRLVLTLLVSSVALAGALLASSASPPLPLFTFPSSLTLDLVLDLGPLPPHLYS